MTAPTIEETVEEPDAKPPEQAIGDAPTGPGYLLDPALSPAEIFKYLQELWSAQQPVYDRRIKQTEVNGRIREGESNLWVEKVPDQASYRIYAPPGASLLVNAHDRKADRLCHRVLSYLYPDPAQPEAVPTTGEDEDRDSADLSTRVLTDVGGEAHLDDVEAHKHAFDLASNGGSGYVGYFTDPTGGGRKPVEVQVRVTPEMPAQSVDDALMDPETGQDWAGPTTTMFARPDGSLTENEKEAALKWQPKLYRRVADSGNIRLYPPQVQNIGEADGCFYAAYEPWHVLVGWYPELANTSEEDQRKAISYRHRDFDHLLPKKMGKKHDPAPPKGHEEEGLALHLCYWHLESPSYEDGCYVCCVGDNLTGFRGPWILETETKRESRDLPWTQIKQWRSQHPAGQGLMDFLAALNEQRSELHGRALEWLDRSLRRKIFVPIHSTLQPEDFENEFGQVFPIAPGGQPFYEDVPDMPKELPEMIERNEAEMDDASFLQEAGQGLQTDNVNSGRQALAVVSQVHAGLADVNQNVNKARVRGWRIQLQELRQLGVPTLLKYVGEDGRYKVQRYQGSDLGSTRDVQIKRGTGTMYTPFQKADVLAQVGPMAGLQPEDTQELLASGLSPHVAIQDNKIMQRVRRQIAEWEQGPPEGWMPPQAPVDPLTGQPPMVMGPMGPMPAPPPVDPVMGRIFKAVPADTMPLAARVRVRELGLVQCTAKYETFPDEWKVGLEAEFGRMQTALAPPPMMAPPAPEEPQSEKPSDGAPPLQKPEQAVLGQSAESPVPV